eukprot:6455862-Amphidinium_carterae.1
MLSGQQERIPCCFLFVKTNRSGHIAGWLKRLCKKEFADSAFAYAYKVQGEAVVAAESAAEMLSRLNDLFYGQWLVLHVPFVMIKDFETVCSKGLDLVPKEHKNFAMAILNTHEVARQLSVI